MTDRDEVEKIKAKMRADATEAARIANLTKTAEQELKEESRRANLTECERIFEDFWKNIFRYQEEHPNNYYKWKITKVDFQPKHCIQEIELNPEVPNIGDKRISLSNFGYGNLPRTVMIFESRRSGSYQAAVGDIGSDRGGYSTTEYHWDCTTNHCVDIEGVFDFLKNKTEELEREHLALADRPLPPPTTKWSWLKSLFTASVIAISLPENAERVIIPSTSQHFEI